MAAWTLTIRHGPQVDREGYDDLDDAVAELRRRVDEIRAEGPLESRQMLRDFEPADQVAARLEIAGKGFFRAPAAGVDVKGDGRVVPFAGGIRREEVKPRRGGDAFDAVRQALVG
ncbi:MAG TPA: hypothetical protein VKA89_08475 [Solirubrobacterales bacterium]|nr:hypothetical protein [Solirubrobacterales bacterium]